MAEETEVGAGKIKDEQTKKGDRLPDGRYIPYSGGTMGWYEHTGVAKAEMSNGYLFNTAVDADVFRAKRFQRTGTVQDKRAAKRMAVRVEAGVTLVWGGQTRPATVKDVSAQGMRVQVLDDIALQRGEMIKIRIGETAAEEPQPLLELDSNVVWTEKSGKIRTIWNLGLNFARLDPEDEKRMKRELGVRLGEM